MFYSKQAGGFYDASIHGSRTITIVTPGWVPPTIYVPDPQWVAADHPDEAAPMIEIDDPEAVPPTIEVSNPNCKIPSDAIEITPAQWKALLQSQADGKEIKGDGDGKPIAADRIAIALPAKQISAEKQASLVDAGFTLEQANAILALVR